MSPRKRLVIELESQDYEKLEEIARHQGKHKRQIIAEAIRTRYKNMVQHRERGEANVGS